MPEFIQFTLALGIVLLAAKAGGYLSTRLGQPSVLGELLAGLLLGPTVINLFHLSVWGWQPTTAPHLLTSITDIGEIGVLMLMFVAGLELHLSDLVSTGRVAVLAGILGVIVPLLLGAGVSFLFGLDPQTAWFIGLILSATSVSISAQTLIELGKLRSRVGLALLGAAVFDDILVILFVSVAVAVGVGGGAGAAGILEIVLRMVGFLIGGGLIGVYVLPRLMSRVSRLNIDHGVLVFAVVSMLLYSWAAEVLGGMADITGAFLVGLMFARTPFKREVELGLTTLAYAFFVPVFFVNIGLETNARALDLEFVWIALALVAAAVVGKVLGSGSGARLGGFTGRQSLQLGVGMVSRGEVGLIVASVGLLQGLIEQAMFSTAVVIVIATTLITPPLLRATFVRREPDTVASEQASP
ncbi:MAG: cation:proton antiporter [Anaerolineales bacterium]